MTETGEACVVRAPSIETKTVWRVITNVNVNDLQKELNNLEESNLVVNKIVPYITDSEGFFVIIAKGTVVVHQ